MRDTLTRWSLFAFALLLLGPAAWWLTHGLKASDAFSQTEPILASTGPVIGLARGAGAIALALLAGLITARLSSTRWAVFIAGGTLAWAAAGAGRVDEIIRVTPERSQFWLIAAEGALFGVLVLLGMWFIGLIARSGQGARLDTVPPGHREDHLSHTRDDRAAWLARVGISTAVGIVAGVAVSWLMAVSTLKGQTIAAASVAGIAAGIITGMLNKQGDLWALVLPFVLLSILGPIAAAIIEPATARGLLFSVNGLEILPPARLMPLDWLAGALIGLPIGSKWGVGLVTAERA